MQSNKIPTFSGWQLEITGEHWDFAETVVFFNFLFLKTILDFINVKHDLNSIKWVLPHFDSGWKCEITWKYRGYTETVENIFLFLRYIFFLILCSATLTVPNWDAHKFKLTSGNTRKHRDITDKVVLIFFWFIFCWRPHTQADTEKSLGSLEISQKQL